jgi:S1-C subfamily serine protease
MKEIKMYRYLLIMVLPMLVAAAPPAKPAPSAKGFFGVQIRANEAGEIVVQIAFPDSPAEKAGLRGGDVLLRIGGAKPTTLAAAVKYIRSLKPGKKIKVLVRRDKKEKEFIVEVGTLSDG